jgi:hypothetical protein
MTKEGLERPAEPDSIGETDRDLLANNASIEFISEIQ